jgi:hypothetical protein
MYTDRKLKIENMTGDPSGDGRPREELNELRKTLSAFRKATAGPFLTRLQDGFQECKREVRRGRKRVEPYIHHLMVTSVSMMAIVAFPTTLAIVGALLHNRLFQGSVAQVFAINAVFFGLAGMAAVGYVYVARVGFWLRRTIIEYWRTRTLPFPVEDDNNRALPACDVDEVPETDWETAEVYSLKHVAYALTLSFVGFWTVTIMSVYVPGFKGQVVLDILTFLTQVFAVLLGGLPGLAGYALASFTLPSSGSMGQTSLLALIVASFVPALLLAVAVRNLAYWGEVQFEKWWDNANRWWRWAIRGYLILVVYSIVQEFYPGVLPI